MASPESFFQKLTRLFRSGPAIQRRVKGYDSRSYYNNKLIQGNYGYRASAPFGFGRENSPFSVMGSYGILDRMARYAEFSEMEYCIIGETKIAVPGGYKTIKELSEEHGLSEDFIVYSYDHNKKKIVPALGKQARKTRTDHAWTVKFDNGKEITGTTDHRLMKRDGTYCEIQDLKSGDAMMPFYRKALFSRSKETNERVNEYLSIYEMDKAKSKNGWRSEHRMIAEWAYRDIEENEVVHHKNFKKSDNNPSNLEIMDAKEHAAFHARLNNEIKWSANNKEWIALFKKNHSAWMSENNPAQRRDITFGRILEFCENSGFNLYSVSKAFDTDPNVIKRRLRANGFKDFVTFARAYDKNWKSDSWDNRGSKNPRFNASLTFGKICNAYKLGMTQKELGKCFGVSPVPIKKRLKENGFNTWGDFTNNYKNLKVASVEYHGVVDLYDLTVDGYKNFATDSVISHNTPEISTALDITADEIVGGDDRGKSFHIYSSNEQIKSTLDDLFYDTLNVEFNLKPWCRNLVKHGDFFLYNEVLPDIGIINVTPIAVNELEREEGFDLEDPYAVRFKWLTRGNKFLENWQVSHFRILSNDLFLPYGTSVLESARRIWRQLCHEHGTRVWTSSGWEEIQNLKAGDAVYTFDHEKTQLVKTKVKAVSSMGAQPILSVRTAHREINVTPNHGLLVKSSDGTFKYKKASDLVLGKDSLVLPKNTFEGKVPEVTFDSVKKQCSVKLRNAFEIASHTAQIKSYRETTGDKGFYEFFKGKKKIGYEKFETLCSYVPELRSCDLEYFRKFTKKPMNIRPNKNFYVDENFCRFLGFMLGDGWALPAGFGFALGVEDKQNDYYRNYAKHVFGDLNEVYTPPLPNKRGAAVGYGSMEAKLVLQNLGFISGFDKKRIPDWVFECPLTCKTAFLEGLMDADGSRTDNRITLANKALVQDAKTLAEMSGVSTSKKLTELSRPGRKKSFRITINTNIQKEHHHYEKVCSLKEKQGLRETYDLQVENPLHNFVAEGVVTHNTMLEDAMLVYRVVRSPERRVFYIDVGNIDPNDVPSYMDAAKATLRSRGVTDRETGREDQRLNAMPIAWDSIVPLLDGRNITIKQLAEEHDAGKTNWVHSIDDKTTELVPGKVAWCGKNYTAKKLVKVTLDDGSVVRTAPEHPFILRDNTNRRADELVVGESLMPFYRRHETALREKVSATSKKGYSKVYDPKSGKFKFVHRIVGNSVLKEQKTCVQEQTSMDMNKYLVVHHKDLAKHNNNPDNLQWIGNVEHSKLHQKLNIKGFKKLMEYVKTPENRKRVADNNRKLGLGKKLAVSYNETDLHKQHNELRKEAQLKSWKKDKQLRSKAMRWQLPVEAIELAKELIEQNPSFGRRRFQKILLANNEFADLLKKSNKNIKRNPTKFSEFALKTILTNDYGYVDGFNDLRREVLSLSESARFNDKKNHKITNIEVIEEEDCDVYCMTVVGPSGEDDRHNFAVLSNLQTTDGLQGGVIIRNSVLDDYFIPVRGNAQGTKVESLAGATHATATEDVEYIQSKMFAALKVPKPYMNFDENLSAKASLSQMDVRFSRTIQGFQKIIVAELNKLAMIHLFAKGFDGADLIDFELKLSNPSSVALQQKLELWDVKFATGGSAKETGLVDKHWIQKNLLQLTEEEVAEINKGLVKDRLEEMELEALEPVDYDYSQPAKTTDPFDPTNYEVPGAGVKKEPMEEQEPVQSGEIGLSKFRSYDGEGNSVVVDLEPGRTPIKATPFLTKHKRNRKRRVGVGKGRQNMAMPDLAAMLSPKNKYTRDIYGQRTESVDRTLTTKKNRSSEEIQGIELEPKQSREMTSIFEKLTRFVDQHKKKFLKEQQEEEEIIIDIEPQQQDDSDAIIMELTARQDGSLEINSESTNKENDSDGIDSIDETSLAEVFNEDD